MDSSSSPNLHGLPPSVKSSHHVLNRSKNPSKEHPTIKVSEALAASMHKINLGFLSNKTHCSNNANVMRNPKPYFKC
jgi:hypothetical protein